MTTTENLFYQWLEKYYQTPAEDFMYADRYDEETVKKAIEHSLTKWRGLRAEVLKAHKLALEGTRLFAVMVASQEEKEKLLINADTCALCQMYEDINVTHPYITCNECPLNEYLGERCDYTDMPYDIFTRKLDPEPMIEALEKVLEGVK